MTIIVDIALSFLAGLLAHQTAPIIESMPDDWAHLTGDTVGVIGTMPIFFLWLWRLRDIKSKYLWALSAFLIGFLLFGLGVASGRMVDTLRRE